MFKFLRIKKLEKFLNPKNIAVIGASDIEGKVGNTLMQKLMRFEREIIPVNTEKDTIFEKKAYHSVLDYPNKIDLAIIAIPAPHVKTVLEECGKKNIKNVIIISAGFSEMGNKEMENELKELGKKYSMRILGPNCFGVANPSLNLDTTFANMSAKEGDIAFISQSGALWSYIADVSSSDGNLGFSGFVSLGNMADLEFFDFIEYFNKDKKTKKIVLYIERLKNGRKFIDVCKKSKKEIIVIKSGRTKTGSEATLSHTGSLATDYEIYKGAFKQAGVKLESSFLSAFGISNLKIEPKGKKIGIITNAGGAGALVTDHLVEEGYEALPPVDVLGTALAEDYKKAFDALKDKVDSVIVILTPQSMSQPDELAKEIVKFAKVKPVIAFFLGADSVKKAKSILEKNKIPCITDI
jgi:acyl-CoA synthetase (NDP forming)